MTLKELRNRSKVIDWVSYFGYAFQQINRKVTEDEAIVVYSPDYMTNLSVLIEQHLSQDETKMYCF